MEKKFEILNLPNDVYVTLVDRIELRKSMDKIWNDVFPHMSDLKKREVSSEREIARKEVLKKFNENVFCLDILFFEKSSNQPIGWIMGEQHDFETFYLRNSGFVPKFRRRGLYSIVHAAIVDYLKMRGFERIVSDHLPNNKPMLILKINDGYVINNMTFDDRFGPMVRLVKFLHEDRQQIFEERFRLPDYRNS